MLDLLRGDSATFCTALRVGLDDGYNTARANFNIAQEPRTFCFIRPSLQYLIIISSSCQEHALLNLMFWFHALLVGAAFLTRISNAKIQLGDEVCVEGLVMDKYCIDLGVLLDNQSVRTLEGPHLHSVHW